MHYLYRVNRLQCDTGAQKTAAMARIVILQPQRPVKDKNQLLFVLLSDLLYFFNYNVRHYRTSNWSLLWTA